MKPFESPLACLLEQYISYRRSLGYSDKSLRSQLRKFDSYVCDQNANLQDLNPKFFLDLRKTLQPKPHTFNALLLAMRGFFAYLVRGQVIAENPLVDIQSYAKGAFIPFVFSPSQTDQLLDAVRHAIRKNQSCFFTDLSVYLAILLLARCGLRISEPLRLLLEHYDERQGTIYIEKTKFSKDRLIPIPKSAMAEMDNFLAVRKVFVKDDHPFLLPGKNSRSLSKKMVYTAFDRAVKTIGIDQPRRTVANTTFGKPTPHSLRHYFAINTLKRIRQQGRSTQHALPVLSAYLGHRKCRYTAVYLKVLDAEHRQALVDFSIHRQEEI